MRRKYWSWVGLSLSLVIGCGDEAFIDDNRNEIDDREEAGYEDWAEVEQPLASAGRVSGLYCGDGNNGHARGSLYRYDARTRTFSLVQVCPAGCGVNAAGVNDACASQPSNFERQLAAAARQAQGAARASVITGVAARGGTTWLTDVSGGDGAALRQAIQAYHNWPGSRQNGVPTRAQPPANVQATMGNALVNYNTTDRNTIIQQIVRTYNGTVPQTDQATLTYLNIRAQCKETVDRWVQDTGGTSRTYANYNTRALAAGHFATYTEGKGVTWRSNAHIAVITRVNRDAVGNLLSIEVTESNWGSGFSRPGGQIPWSRMVNTRTIRAPISSDYRVFAF